MTPRLLALLSWAGLVLLHLLWHGWLAPPLNGSRLLALSLTVGPLLLPLLALRRGLSRALRSRSRCQAAAACAPSSSSSGATASRRSAGRLRSSWARSTRSSRNWLPSSAALWMKVMRKSPVDQRGLRL